MARPALILFALFFVDALCVGTGSAYASPPHARTVSGRIVAYSVHGVLTPCLNGNEYWSMLIHVRQPKHHQATFARVDFSLPCGKPADWIWRKAGTRVFHLLRDTNCDQALDEFIELSETESKEKSAIALWKHPRGTQDILPFGRVVPCYRSANLPYVPVL